MNVGCSRSEFLSLRGGLGYYPHIMSGRLFLLDGMALVYRAHFALIRDPIMTANGLNTSAVFGFTNTLLSILEKEKPTHIALAWDTPEPTARHEAYPAYKAQREAMPEGLSEALPYVDRLLGAMGIPVLRMPGYEADDIIGTLARQAEAQGFDTVMVTPDKDYAQLVDEHTVMFKPAYRGSGFDVLGVADVLEKWEIERVEQVVDVLGLMGDTSDNIPGIPGIGEKTAKKLIQQFGSVEDLLENTDQLKGKQKEKVEEHADQGRLSKELVTINCEVPVGVQVEELVRGDQDDDALKALFVELEFNQIGQRLFGDGFKAGRGQGMLDLGLAEGDAPEGQSTLKTLPDTEHDYVLVNSPAEREQLAVELAGLDAFCFDTETTGLDARTAEILGIAFATAPGKAWYATTPDEDALNAFRGVLEDPGVEKTGHNLKYDLKVLRWHGIEVKGRFFDTMLAHALEEPDQRHGMDFLAEAYLGYSPISITTLIGEKGEEQKTMAEVPLDRVAEYAAEDADVTLRLRDALAPRLKEGKLAEVFHDMEARLMPILAGMEVEGIRLDVDALAEYSERLGEEAVALEAAIYEAAGEAFNLNSPKQLGVILFENLRLVNAPKRTKTGQYQTNEQVLIGLSHHHDIVRKVLDYRQVTKLKSTYVDTLPGTVLPATGRVHTTYGQLATATGRLVSAHPNLQNIPIRSEKGQEIRKAFIARDDDHVLLSADYSQIELRIMAALCGDPEMAEAFTAGQDIHAAMAARVHGVGVGDVSREMRSQAKMVNYGLMYGMSAFGLSQRLGIPRKDAGEIVDAYFSEFPGIRKYIHDTIVFAREHEYVETVAGRRRNLPDINSRNGTTRAGVERYAINTPIQGTGADMIKLAMVKIDDAFRDRGLASRMILQVHDELVFDVVQREVEDVEAVVRECMETALPLGEIPIEVEMGIGPNWLEAH